MTSQFPEVEPFNRESMDELLQQDLNNSRIDYPALALYLNTHRNHPDFQNVLQAFRGPAILAVLERFPNVDVPIIFDITRTRRSYGYINFLEILDNHAEVIPLRTRLRTTAINTIATMRSNPGKTIGIIIFIFLIISGAIVVAALRNKFTNSDNNNNNQTDAPLNETTTPAPTVDGPVYEGSPIPQEMTSAWVYTALIDPNTGRVIGNDPASLLEAIESDNANTTDTITVFTYGGSMEIYHPNTVNFYYDYGLNNTRFFCNAAKSNMRIMTIIDGDTEASELDLINRLSLTNAKAAADVIARQMFANDNCSAGVMFDLEPFQMNSGQANFYKQIARNFADTAFNCRNSLFPKGRIFGIFASALQLNGELGQILNKYRNGFWALPLYDKGNTSPTPLATYQSLVDNEIKTMLEAAQAYNIRYQFIVPAAATAHEFETNGGVLSNISQSEYVKIALDAMASNNVHNDPHFMGVSVWAYSHAIFFKSQGRVKLATPTMPEPETIEYLSQNSRKARTV